MLLEINNHLYRGVAVEDSTHTVQAWDSNMYMYTSRTKVFRD